MAPALEPASIGPLGGLRPDKTCITIGTRKVNRGESDDIENSPLVRDGPGGGDPLQVDSWPSVGGVLMRFESSTRPWWNRVSRSVQAVPSDLFALLGLLLVVNLAFRVPGFASATIAGARLQILLAIPTLLFVPGYVLVAIVFPGGSAEGIRHRDDYDPATLRSIDSIDLVERTALSFGMSVALLPLLGLVMAPTIGFGQLAVLGGLTVLLFGGIIFATIRRLRLPPSDRYAVQVRRSATDLRRSLTEPEATVRLANIVLIVGIIAAVGSVGYAVATPYQSGQSSTLYLVAENETGAQVAGGYPTNFTVGESQSLTVGVSNDEEREQPYTVVVAIERVQTNATEATITESQELDRLHPVVAAGETWTGEHTVTPDLVGENLRLHYYLYKGENAPSDPTPSGAYRDAYVWVNVTSL